MMRSTAIAIGCTAIVAAGCATTDSSNEEIPVAADITRASDSISAAESAGAYEHGSAELNRAREKLSQAEDAAEDGDTSLAMRLAREAQLDADLANAIAQNQQAQAAATELDRGIATLQEEINRNARGATVTTGGAQSQ
jgi:chromosome segregation ATPase